MSLFFRFDAAVIGLFVFVFTGVGSAPGAQAAAAGRYFGHEAREDRHGVIAPWYGGLNGQCDLRVRIAAETLKRYPWKAGKDGKQLPDYIYSGRWSIADDGAIKMHKLEDWSNGDLVQRGTYAIFGLVPYYRYSGDPAAIAHICMIADAMLDRCQTGPEHEWPNFIISVPNYGEPYGPCSDKGMIQLDLAAMAGIGLVQVYAVTGNERYLEAARHWGQVLAAKRSSRPGESPWNRYANPQDVFWNDRQTGSVLLIVRLLDELIRVADAQNPLSREREGPAELPEGTASLIEARDAGRAYLADVLLPVWHVNDTWGRDYWDWEHAVQSETLSEMVPRYLMHHPAVFPNWRNDARNIMSLYLTRSCVSPRSNGDVYSGAWSYPEGSQCCGRSLSYGPMQVGAAFAEYGVLADDAWAREMARRQFILATYDAHETGVVEDNMDGGQVVAGGWLQIAHPLPLAYVLDGMGWLPEVLGANRENHIMRSSSIVSRVTYAPGRVSYRTFDAPWQTTDVLRLAFTPTRVSLDGQDIAPGDLTSANGYITQPLPNGDCIVTLRHDGKREVIVEGEDPQKRVEAESLRFEGQWKRVLGARETESKDSAVSFSFEGNQVRVIGAVTPHGGRADVYIDGEKQLCGVDYWNPYEIGDQVVYYRNGLADGRHVLRIVAAGARNPLSQGARVSVKAIDYSAATGRVGTGEGGGPTEAQRWVFGYTGREDYVDAQGQAWRPATEVVIRLGHLADAVAAWFVEPRRLAVEGTDDPVLYRHGMHGQDFTAYATVGPGRYHVRLKFMESRWNDEPAQRSMDVFINGKPVVEDLDIAATAAGKAALQRSINSTKIYAGLNRAVDLVFNDIEPEHGVIAVRFVGKHGGEAIVSAMEVAPGDGGSGATPIAAPASQPGK